jgi:hypothetical protein
MELSMTKKWRWLVSGGLLWGMLAFPQLLWAQMPLEKVSWQYVERLGDRELQQLSGQGSALPAIRLDQPVNGIKLWDEWSRPQQQGPSGSTGQNQVVLTGPRR